jgi:septal ring factor EnvC (AmiA/AmiB activator)
MIILVIEGSLEVKLPTIWTDEKQSREEAERRERLERRVRRKKMQMREKVGKSRNTWAPEGRKVGSLKRRVRSQLAR